MGATLPTLTRYLSGDQHLSRAFSRLYAANTFGAILGTIAAGFFLIELLGLSGTLSSGPPAPGSPARRDRDRSPAGRRRGRDRRPSAPKSEASTAARQPTVARRRRARPDLALLVAFVSGPTSLGYQTLWNRLLSSGTGNSTYVFSSILAIFLIGLVLGATAYAILRPRITRPILFLAVAQLAVVAITVSGLIRVIGGRSSIRRRLSRPSGRSSGRRFWSSCRRRS